MEAEAASEGGDLGGVELEGVSAPTLPSFGFRCVTYGLDEAVTCLDNVQKQKETVVSISLTIGKKTSWSR